MQVRLKNLSGFNGNTKSKQQIRKVTVEITGVYNVVAKGEKLFLVDDEGNEALMTVKPYANSNKCDYYITDHSYANEAHADLIVVNGEYDL